MVPVEIDHRVMEMLLASNWLKGGEITDKLSLADRKKIGVSIAAMLADSSK